MAHSARRPVKRPKPSPDIISTITVDDETLTVHTEDGGKKLGRVVTRVRRKGRVVLRLEADYCGMVHEPDFFSRLDDLMEQLHESALKQCWLRRFMRTEEKTAYLDEATHHLKQGQIDAAIRVLRDAVERFDRDPFLISHYGYVLSLAGDAPEAGIDLCRHAIQHLEEQIPLGARYFQPAFYLNLGRAHLAARDKAEALKAFTAGLDADPGYGELLWEVGKLGRRKRPVVPFLNRDNPINKYLGLLPRLGVRRRRRHRAASL